MAKKKVATKKSKQEENSFVPILRDMMRSQSKKDEQTYTLDIKVPTEFSIKHEKKTNFLDSMFFYTLFFFGCWCLGWIIGPLFSNLFTIN